MMRGGDRGGGRGSGRGGRGSGQSYSNPCLTMHQPWASLLVHGIKRIEGRSWPAPLTGRLWIHAAGKVPEQETIDQMENFYREIYAVDGIHHIDFPKHYPVSRLVGCVDIVGCLKGNELASWDSVPESVRLEALTDFCWLCESPKKLVVPFEMRGYQGVYNLEKRIFEAAVRGLSSVEGPQPIKFPSPDSLQPNTSKAGSPDFIKNANASSVEKAPSVSRAIAGARAAATQYTRKDHNSQLDIRKHDYPEKSEKMESHAAIRPPSLGDGSLLVRYPSSSAKEHIYEVSEEKVHHAEIKRPSFTDGSLLGRSPSSSAKQHIYEVSEEKSRSDSQDLRTRSGESSLEYPLSIVRHDSLVASRESNGGHNRHVGSLQHGAPSHKLFAAAMKDLNTK